MMKKLIKGVFAKKQPINRRPKPRPSVKLFLEELEPWFYWMPARTIGIRP